MKTNLKNLVLATSLLVGPAMCATDAHADNASVVSTELNDSGQTADSGTDVLAIIADGVTLADIGTNHVLDFMTGCTVANACIDYFDPAGAKLNSASSTTSARLEEIKATMLAWRGKHQNGRFQIGIAPVQSDTHFENLLTVIITTRALPTAVPTWAPVNQTNSRNKIHNGSTVVYAPVGFFAGFSDENHLPVGTYKTSSGTKLVYTPADNGSVLLAPAAGESAIGLPFSTGGTRISLPFAASAAAAWTGGAPKSVVLSSSSFTTLASSQSVMQLPSGNF